MDNLHLWSVSDVPERHWNADKMALSQTLRVINICMTYNVFGVTLFVLDLMTEHPLFILFFRCAVTVFSNCAQSNCAGDLAWGQSNTWQLNWRSVIVSNEFKTERVFFKNSARFSHSNKKLHQASSLSLSTLSIHSCLGGPQWASTTACYNGWPHM